MKKKLQLRKNTNRAFKRFIKAKKREKKFHNGNIVEKKKIRFSIETDHKLIQQAMNSVFMEFGSLITPGTGSITIQMPVAFSFDSNYEESMHTIKELASSMYDYLGGTIITDFTKCWKVDCAALFTFQIVRMEISNKLNFLQRKLKNYTVVPTITMKLPKSKDVVRLLSIMGYPIYQDDIKELENDSSLLPFHYLGFVKGSKSQNHYRENKKSVYTATVVNYLNTCLDEHGYVLTEAETNNIDGILGEVLSNAEDHSGKKHWFLTANFSKEMSAVGNEDVGELNIVIMNFGLTIYEAFLETKRANKETFTSVNKYVQHILKVSDNGFDEERLFVLATMQEQVSRLKFERESRGTGTIKFLNSFMELGDFVDKAKKYVPHLSIFTGKAHMICDTEFKPYINQNVYCLSLNPENDLTMPPKSTHLKKLKSKFPGTLLSLKLYLNKKHLEQKFGGNYGN